MVISALQGFVLVIGRRTLISVVGLATLVLLS